MTKYRIEVSSSVVIEAESIADAEREFEAMREGLASRHRLPADEERDLLLNAKIERLEIEEPWQE